MGTLKTLASGKVERFSYINWTAWHRSGRKKPREMFIEWVEVRLSPLPSWEDMVAHKRQALFRRKVRELEQHYRSEREHERRRPLGPERLAKIDPRSRPKRPPKKKGNQPLCHSSTLEGEIMYEKKYRAFLDQYYKASGLWMKGMMDAPFPAGSFKAPLIRLTL